VVVEDSYESESCVLDDSFNFPIALRKEPRATAGKPLEQYGFEHDIATMCRMTRCVFVGGNLASWRSKKQPVVSRSTAEAEYRAISVCLSVLLRMKGLLSELWRGPLNIWCDNPVINIAKNPVQHDRTKHVEIDRFFIKEQLDEGTLKLSHVNSKGQIADCLTKRFCSKQT
jgi:hypothetical protein